MFAIINFAGHQYKVKQGDKLVVDRLETEPGNTIDAKEVLLTFDAEGNEVSVGQPFVAGAKVTLKVLEHKLADKVRVYKKIPKKRKEVNRGFRASQTVVEVTEISS